MPTFCRFDHKHWVENRGVGHQKTRLFAPKAVDIDAVLKKLMAPLKEIYFANFPGAFRWLTLYIIFKWQRGIIIYLFRP